MERQVIKVAYAFKQGSEVPLHYMRLIKTTHAYMIEEEDVTGERHLLGRYPIMDGLHSDLDAELQFEARLGELIYAMPSVEFDVQEANDWYLVN